MTRPRRYRTQQCRAFLAGHCPRGNSCTFIHNQIQTVQTNTDANRLSAPQSASPSIPSMHVPIASEPSQASSSNTSHPRASNGHPKRGEIPCRAWKAGSCPKGAKCWFGHDPEVQETERRRRAATERRAAEAARREQLKAQRIAREQAEREEQDLALRVLQDRIEREARELSERAARERTEREARELAERLKREREAEERRIEEERQHEERRVVRERLREEEEARRAAQAKEDASKTIQRAVFGSIVTFGAGLGIPGLITGFECCSVRVRNLPTNALDREICALFTQQGIDSSRFLLAGVKRLPNNTKEATIVMDAESGRMLSVGLDEIEFRDRQLTFEVGAYNSPGKMDQSKALDLEVLNICWRAPTVRYVATYDYPEAAQAMIRDLDGTTHFGRRLKVEKNTPPPGRMIFIDSNSVKISNLPLSVTCEEVSGIAQNRNVRRLPTKVSDIPEASMYLRTAIQGRLGHLDGSLLSLERAPNSGRNGDVFLNFRARFSSWDVAKEVHDYLKDTKLPHIWTFCWLKLPTPFTFNMTIPKQQYEVQRDQWNDLVTSIKDTNKCNLSISADSTWSVHRIKLSGPDKAAVGAMRVRVENLAAGESVEGWHASLGGAFARSLFRQSGAYMRTDWRQRQIKVFGAARSVEVARTRIAEELARLVASERTVTLPRTSVRFFMSQGLAELRALLGEDNVELNAATRVLITSGSEEAQHAVARLLRQASSTRVILENTANDQQSCPICFDNVDVPIQLGCGHVYCTSCLRHYLSNAADGNKFPIVCIGDEGHCETPIPIPTFERLLTPPAFIRLLEAVFSDYIAKRPQELRYCKTADCAQIYRASATPAALQCPSCLSTVCAACHEDGHDGMSCQEARLRNPAEQERAMEEWIQQQGGNVKKCPQCRALLEKNGGCNHIECRCGAHVCWRCLRIFPHSEIYPHMSAVHGGYFDEEIERTRPAIIDNEPVDLREQQDLYAQARHEAHLAEVRFDEERRQRVEREQVWEDQVRAVHRRAQLQRQQWQEQEQRRAAEERRDQLARVQRLRHQEWQERRAAEAEAEGRQQRARLEQLRRQQWQERRAAEEAERRRANEDGGWCTVM